MAAHGQVFALAVNQGLVELEGWRGMRDVMWNVLRQERFVFVDFPGARQDLMGILSSLLTIKQRSLAALNWHFPLQALPSTATVFQHITCDVALKRKKHCFC